jgi:hypothetical protein
MSLLLFVIVFVVIAAGARSAARVVGLLSAPASVEYAPSA